MKTALFTNFTDKEFTGYWDGKGKKFQPGDSLYMPDYLARHFARGLTNQELLSTNPDGTPKYKDGEKMTSPKFPEQVPLFMELFNKAYQPDNTEDLGDKQDDIDSLIGAANKNRGVKSKMPEEVPSASPRTQSPNETSQDPTHPQIITPPDFDDADEEGSFQGKPQEK